MPETQAPQPAPLTKKDFKSDQEVRWCPGCGDYAILNVIQGFMPELGIERDRDPAFPELRIGRHDQTALDLAIAEVVARGRQLDADAEEREPGLEEHEAGHDQRRVDDDRPDQVREDLTLDDPEVAGAERAGGERCWPDSSCSLRSPSPAWAPTRRA